jgi:hypothetical protein
MALTASDTGGNFVRAPKGVHPAICYSVIDLGTQVGNYEGKRYERHQVFISWELPDQPHDFDGVTKPIAISEFYTLSLNEKANLRHMLEGWRSKSFSKDELEGFDIKNILGKPCLINIIDKNDRARVASVMPADDRAKQFEIFNHLQYFSIEEDMEIPENIPEGIKKIIMKAKEFNGDTDDYDTMRQGIKKIIMKANTTAEFNGDTIAYADDYDTMRQSEPPQHGDDDIPF